MDAPPFQGQRCSDGKWQRDGERKEAAGQGKAHPLSTLAAPGEARGPLGLPRGTSLVLFCKLLPDKKG